jgi:hypothetical protein
MRHLRIATIAKVAPIWACNTGLTDYCCHVSQSPLPDPQSCCKDTGALFQLPQAVVIPWDSAVSAAGASSSTAQSASTAASGSTVTASTSTASSASGATTTLPPLQAFTSGTTFTTLPPAVSNSAASAAATASAVASVASGISQGAQIGIGVGVAVIPNLSSLSFLWRMS